MRSKAVLEIKTSSSDFRIRNSSKREFIIFPQCLLVVWSFSFNTFSPDKLKVKMLHALPLNNLDSQSQCVISSDCPSSIFSSVFILSSFASLANLSACTKSHALGKAAWLEFNTFLWHGRLGSHDHFVT